jgi:hypothetical protein
VLVLILGWRMFGGRRVVRKDAAAAAAQKRRCPGEDSEFYALERSLPLRDPGETQAAWLKRIASDISQRELDQISAALQLHQRYRFDPQGLAATERNALRELCRSLAPRTP